MMRYVAGLIGAFLVFGAALVIAPMAFLVVGGRPVRVTASLDAWVQMGLLCTTGLALIVGPTIAVMRHLSRRALPVMAAAFVGASLRGRVVGIEERADHAAERAAVLGGRRS